MSVASSNFLALNSPLIPYLGKIIFHASDWEAASAKKTDVSGLYAPGST